MAVEAVTFTVYDVASGNPITGIAGTMSFAVYKDDLGTNLTPPSITEIGGGVYRFIPTFSIGRAICYLVNTNNNSPFYYSGVIRPEDLAQLVFAPSPGVIVFAIYDPLTELPKTGVVPTFTQYSDQNNVALSQPSIIELGGGLYKFTPSFANTNEVVYVISDGNDPLYYSGGARIEDMSATGFIAVSAIGAPNQVTISFAAGFQLDALSGFVSNPANWSISGSPAVTISGVTLSSNTIVLTTSVQSSGANYTINFPLGITANTGTFAFLGPYAMPFVGAAGDPTLINARSIDERTVDVFFSFAPQPLRATDLTQYSITPALTITAIQPMSPVWYRLTTGPQTIGQSYNLTWPLH